MLTPDSAAAPYAGVADLLARRDYREVGPLALDDTSSDEPTPSELLTNAAVLAALADASGEVESAVTAGGRYTPADLQALGGNSLAFLKGVVCAIAFQKLRERRGAQVDPLPDCVRALKVLEDLGSGGAILAFAEAQRAGLPVTSRMTLAERRAIGLPSTISRAFGHRGRPGFDRD